MKYYILTYWCLLFFVSCGEKEHAKTATPVELVGPARESQKILPKSAWEGNFIIDLDSIVRSPSSALKKWREEWYEPDSEKSDNYGWLLPNGSSIEVAKEQANRPKQGDAVFLFGHQIKNHEEALNVCGYDPTTWHIVLLSENKEAMKGRDECVWINKEYQVGTAAGSYKITVSQTDTGKFIVYAYGAKEKEVWNKVPIVDIDTIVEMSLDDILAYRTEYIDFELSDGSSIWWKLEDGSSLIADKDRKSHRVFLDQSKWSYTSPEMVLAACGFRSNKWDISKESDSIKDSTKYKVEKRLADGKPSCSYEIRVEKDEKGGYSLSIYLR